MTNEEFRKLQLACREAGLSNNDAIRIRISAETGAGSLLKSVLDGNTAGALKAIQAEEAKAAQAKESAIDELSSLAQTAAAAMADPAHPDKAPLLSKEELESVYQNITVEEPELSEEQLKQLEELTAQAMTLPGSDWRSYLD